MKKLSDVGRIFYGVALAGMGVNTVVYKALPYMLLPPWHYQAAWLTYLFGVIFILTGLCLIFAKKARETALLLGGLFLLIFCLCFVPYQLLVSPNYMHLGDWENAEKELAFAGGAFAIAGCFQGNDKNVIFKFLARLIPAGAFIFAITIVSFGILHFLFAKPASTLIPNWIPNHMFWIYFAGVALLGSGLAIIFRIKTGLFAALLGLMVFIWFVSLHIPRVVAADTASRGDEITSAFLALVYSGIALVIAGAAYRNKSTART